MALVLDLLEESDGCLLDLQECAWRKKDHGQAVRARAIGFKNYGPLAHVAFPDHFATASA